MFSHFTLGSNDLTRAEGFYKQLLPTLGLGLLDANLDDGYVMFGPPGGGYPHLFLVLPFDELAAKPSNGFQLGFNAASQQVVDDFYRTAIALGAISEGEPGLRSRYADDYYAAYIRDLDGNKLQVACYLNGRTSDAVGDVVTHITLGYEDFDREQAFYRAIFAPLGIVDKSVDKNKTKVEFGLEGFKLPMVYLLSPFDGQPASRGNGIHIAFKAPSRDAVDRFYEAALNNGGTCEGEPGLRPQYSEHYYAAYVRDAVGNKLQAVCRQAE